MKPLLFLLGLKIFVACLFYFKMHSPSVKRSFVKSSSKMLPPSHAYLQSYKAGYSATKKALLNESMYDKRIFEKVEIEASIDSIVWRGYLTSRLQSIFDSAAVNIPIGSYQVNVQFVVETNGSISSAVALNDPGYGLAKASTDAIREGPRWKPGQMFKGVVPSYHTQPITFILEEAFESDTSNYVRPDTNLVRPKDCVGDTTKATSIFL